MDTHTLNREGVISPVVRGPEFQVIMSHPAWGIGIELWSFRAAASAFEHWVISLASNCYFLVIFSGYRMDEKIISTASSGLMFSVTHLFIP